MDSGGSKTELKLYSISGDLIKDGNLRGFGSVSDSEDVLDEAVRDLSDFCKGHQIAVVVCNLGGKNKKQMEATLKSAFDEATIALFRESEGIVGIELCKKYSAQVTVMVGTGTIAIAPCDEKVVIWGGWGANISDKGSGYQLGLDAIRSSLEEIDGTEPISLLTKTIAGINAPPNAMSAADYCDYRDNVRKRISPFDRAHIASYAKTVYLCAKSGCKRSIELYDKVGYDLAETVLAASRKARSDINCVVVNGGMVHSRQFWQESFENRLKKEYDTVVVHYLTNGIDEVLYDVAKNILQGEK